MHISLQEIVYSFPTMLFYFGFGIASGILAVGWNGSLKGCDELSTSDDGDDPCNSKQLTATNALQTVRGNYGYNLCTIQTFSDTKDKGIDYTPPKDQHSKTESLWIESLMRPYSYLIPTIYAIGETSLNAIS